MNKMKTFVKQFVAIVKGDDAEAQAQKALRQADSALKTQVSSLKGDTIDLEEKVNDAKEAQANALVNNGEVISDRNGYVRKLLAAKNNVTEAEETLKTHKLKIAFLEEQLLALDAESAA